MFMSEGRSCLESVSASIVASLRAWERPKKGRSIAKVVLSHAPLRPRLFLGRTLIFQELMSTKLDRAIISGS